MFLYIIYVLLSPILWILLLLASFFNTKIKDHWNQLWISINLVQEEIKSLNQNKKIVLFHAASAGEFEQLIPILNLIDKKKYYIVQSFFSPTIFNTKIKEENNQIDSICYHTFDFILSSYLFFKKIKPKYYILTRHDIWPTHIFIAHLLKIKIFLLNANLYKKSSRLKFPLLYLNKWTFSYFNKILVPSTRIKENFKLITSNNNLIKIGDSRFDRIKNRMLTNKVKLIPKKIYKTKNIIFGSIIDSDYKIIFNSLKKYFPNGNKSLIEKNIRLIIVPHEVDKNTILTIEKKLKKINMEPTLYNKVKQQVPEIILINKVGILADLYKYCELAYIGGGFGAGVHSVIEPAIYGLLITYGPNIEILDEAVEMTEKKIGYIVKTDSDLLFYFNILNQKTKLFNIKHKTIKFMNNKMGASKKIVDEIFN